MPRQPVPTPGQILPKKKLVPVQGLVGSIRVPHTRVAKSQLSQIADVLRRGQPAILRALDVQYSQEVEEAVTQEQLAVQNLTQEQLIAESRLASQKQAGELERAGLFSAFQNPARQVAKMEALGKRWFNEHYRNELNTLHQRLKDPLNMEDPFEAEAALFREQDLGESSIFRRTVGQLRGDERVRFNALVQGDRDRAIKKLNRMDAEADMVELARQDENNPLIDYSLGGAKEAAALIDRAAKNQRAVDVRAEFGPAQEDLFQEWYRGVRSFQGLPPGTPPEGQHYDYRGLFLTGQNPADVVGPKGHLTDDFKLPGHPTMKRLQDDGTVLTERGVRLKEALEDRMNELYAIDSEETGEREAILALRGGLQARINDNDFEGARKLLEIYGSVNAKGLAGHPLGTVAKAEFEELESRIESAEDVQDAEDGRDMEKDFRASQATADRMGLEMINAIVEDGGNSISDDDMLGLVTQIETKLHENGYAADVIAAAVEDTKAHLRKTMAVVVKENEAVSDPEVVEMVSVMAIDPNFSREDIAALVKEHEDEIDLATRLRILATASTRPDNAQRASRYLNDRTAGGPRLDAAQDAVDAGFAPLLEEAGGVDGLLGRELDKLRSDLSQRVTSEMEDVIHRVFADNPGRSAADMGKELGAAAKAFSDRSFAEFDRTPEFLKAKQLSNEAKLQREAKGARPEAEKPPAARSTLRELAELRADPEATDEQRAKKRAEVGADMQGFLDELATGSYTPRGVPGLFGGPSKPRPVEFFEDGIHAMRAVRQPVGEAIREGFGAEPRKPNLVDDGLDKDLTRQYLGAKKLVGLSMEELEARKTDEGVALVPIHLNPGTTLYFKTREDFEEAGREFLAMDKEDRAEESRLWKLRELLAAVDVDGPGDFDMTIEQLRDTQGILINRYK